MLTGYQLLSEKGSANGKAPFDSGVKIPLIYLPDSILGQVHFGGTYEGTIITSSASYP